MLRRVLLMICIASPLSGCASDGLLGGGDTVVSLHAIHDGEDGTMDGALRTMMRTSSTSTSDGDAGGELAASDALGAAWLGSDCALDDEGHAICCEREAQCCVHDGPDGDLRVCI